MTSEPVVFQWLEISNFRGFGARQRFDLDASAVLVTGPNGSGKTSFFDALQWLLLGTLERLAALKVRKGDDYLGNLFAASSAPVVSAEVRVRGETVLLSRTRVGDGCPLTLTDRDGECDGEIAQQKLNLLLTGPSSSATTVERLLKSSALLQQDANRSVLLESPSDRYTTLAGLLGLDEIAAFGAEAKAREKRLLSATKELREKYAEARGLVEKDRLELRRLETENRPEPEARSVTARVEDRLRRVGHLVEVPNPPVTSSDAALLQESASALGTQFSLLLDEWSSLKDQAAALPSNLMDNAEILRIERQTLNRDLVTLREQLAKAEVKLTAARQQSSQAELLAGLAMEFLGPSCPVCNQAIDENQVRSQLAARMGGATTSNVERLSSEAADLRIRCESVIAELRRIDAQIENERADVARARAVTDALASWQTAARSISPPDDRRLVLHDLDALHAGDSEAIQRTRDALRTVWTSASDLLAVHRVGRNADAITRLRLSLERRSVTADELAAEVSVASQRSESGTTLRRAATESLAAVTDLRFQQAAPLVRDIYDRIAPHRAFKYLDIDFDVHYGKGIASAFAVDTAKGVRADPLLHFSSAQTNVTALSYFLALGWAAGEASLPFLLMDDPVQSMDDINVLGFADLCRYVRRDRQLLLSTHDHRFASLIERKLAPRTEHQSTVVLEFGAWTSRGPQVNQRRLKPQLNEGRLRSVGTGRAA